MEQKKKPPANPKVTQKELDRLIRYATLVPSKAREFKKEVRKNFLKAVLAAFAFVMALVWRDAIKEGVNALVKKSGIEGTSYVYSIITAVVVTTVCVLGIMFFSKMKGKEEVKK